MSMTAKNMTMSISLQIAAIVCQLLRTAGYTDPSYSDSKIWEDFFTWIKNKIQKEEIIKDILKIQELREIYYSRENGYFLSRFLFFIKLVKSSNRYRLIKLTVFGSNIVNALADEIISKCLFRETSEG